MLRNAVKQSKRQYGKALRADVDRDPWGTPYRLVMRKLQIKQGSGAPTDVPTVLKIVEALFLKRVPRGSYPSNVTLGVPLFQISELKLGAKRLESGKAPGPDGISNEVLRATILKKPQLVLDLFNTCLERGDFPKQWKRQKLVLIPKGKSKNPKAPSSWRPLCILDSMGKLYERMILNSVQSELDDQENEELLEMQYWFCEGWSTLHAVQEV